MFKAKDMSYSNRASAYIAEYFTRQRMAKLGFTSSFGELDSVSCEVFMAIDSYVEQLKSDELKKASKRK